MGELQDYGCEVSVHDPIANPDKALHEYGISLTAWEELSQADVLIAAVSHLTYQEMPLNELLVKAKPNSLFIDVKSAYDPTVVVSSGFRIWRL